jgi:outer membrane protein OmpA-like peptidoglycan-associated protein
MKTLFGISAVLCVAGIAQAQDCELGKRYMVLAEDRAKSYANDEAEEFLRKAVETCPSYEAYQQLGELAAQSPDPDHRALAVDAFVSAHELAPSDQARARSLYEYALLLDAAGDPQNAYPLIKAAKTLQADDAEILALDQRLDEQIRNPTTEQLRAGLRASLYTPLRLPAAGGATAEPTVSAAGPGLKTSLDRPLRLPSAEGAAAELTSAPVRGINIPIHFMTGTTAVDDETRPNLMTLARALADAELTGNRFLLVGHADERGDELPNMALSVSRATAIREILVGAEPSLEGRLETAGRGEYEPLDTARTESAYRTNRRIQVLLR